MKILFCIDSLGCGGRERRTTRTLLALASFYPENDYYLAIMHGDIFYREIFSQSEHIKILNLNATTNLSKLFSLFQVILRIRPDVIQTWTLKESVIAGLFKYFFNYSVIASYIADCFGIKSYRLFNWLTNHTADAIVSNSQAGLEAYNVLPSKRVCIPNCYSFSEPNEEDIKKLKKAFSTEKNKIIISVANVQKNKDYKTFLSVAKNVIREKPDSIFLAVGGGNDLDYFKKQVSEHLQDRIIFTGYRKDIESLVEISTVAVLFSFTEGISNSILEYMAHGKPVVACGGGGLSETISDGTNGFLLSSGDVDGATNAILFLLTNPDKAVSMGQAGKEILQRKYTPENVAKSYFSLYESFLRS